MHACIFVVVACRRLISCSALEYLVNEDIVGLIEKSRHLFMLIDLQCLGRIGKEGFCGPVSKESHHWVHNLSCD